MNHLCSKREKKKEEKSFCHFLLKTSGFAGILKVIYLVLVQIDKEKKSIPFPSALLSFLCQKPECWMEVRTMSNLPDNLPVLCHPVNRWFSSLVWFCKNSLQQQSVGFAKLFHLQWAWKQLPRQKQLSLLYLYYLKHRTSHNLTDTPGVPSRMREIQKWMSKHFKM